VHTENLFVNNGGDGEAVEAVCKGLPELYVVTTLACTRALVPLIGRLENTYIRRKIRKFC
jgi:hypothetical protein